MKSAIGNEVLAVSQDVSQIAQDAMNVSGENIFRVILFVAFVWLCLKAQAEEWI